MRGIRSAALLVLMTAGAALPAAAQSLTSLRGLGYPILAADARSEVLGGLGLGLQGLSASLANPAAAAGVVRRGAVVSVAALEQSASMADASDDLSATRFPLIQILYPVGDVVLTAGYGAYLDQSWAVVREGGQAMDGTSIMYRDFIRSTGGIGQFQLGAAMSITDRLAVGAAVGAHTGSRRLQFQRLFDTTSVGDLQSFTETSEVQYSAPTAQLGVRWDPVPILRVGGSVTWGGTLTADSVRGPVSTREHDLPLQVAGGVSAYLMPSLLAAVSGRWSGWSSLELEDGSGSGGAASTARDTWEAGGGLEWDDPARREIRSFPLRLGFQYRQLPFTFVSEAPTEWVVSGGAGMRMGPSAENPVARLDITVQRAERTAVGDASIADLTESAWRFAVSLSIFGN